MVQRRQLLAGVGIATIGGLAGCSSSGNTGSSNDGNESNNEESPNSTSTNQGNKESQQQETRGNEPGNYPEQENEGLMAKLDDFAENQDGVYSFRVDDLNYLQVEKFPNIADEFPNQSDFQELAESSTSIEGYEKALYVAANLELSWTESNDIYFYVANPELTEGPVINMFKDAENNPGEVSDGEGVAVGYPPEGGIGVEPDQGKEYQADFFRDHIDPDGIVHAVDLDEHDYAVEALHSGFGSD